MHFTYHDCCGIVNKVIALIMKTKKEVIMNLKNVILEKKETIAILTINHPPVNTFNLETVRDMETAVTDVEKDKAIRVLIITGGGNKGFSAGFDVTDAANGDELLALGHKLWRRIELFPKPMIACINGFAFGAACELALCCHFRMMEKKERATIGLPELNLGMIPTWGGTQRLPRLIGKTKALELILMSRKLSPEEALSVGLVSSLSEPGCAMEDAMTLAKMLSKRPPLAVAATLKTVGLALDTEIDDGINAEIEAMKKLQGSKDIIEGFTAFMEKREPVFMGE